MALTLAEAAKLTNDVLRRGVIETIVKESAILQHLPFIDVNGTAYTFNRENANADVSFYTVGDTWTEAAATFTQVTETLKIMGTDVDVDNFLQMSYHNPNDQEATQLTLRSKKVAHKYAECALIGDDSVDTKSFDGIKTRIGIGAQTVSMGTNGAALTLDKLDEMIDLVKPGRPDALIMTKRTRRKLNSLRRASGAILETSVNQFGQHVLWYDGIPIVIDEFLPDNEVQGSSGAVCSSIYAVKWGDEGVMGLQAGPGIQVDTIGELETKDATRHRIKWYAGMAILSELGISRLYGITNA